MSNFKFRKPCRRDVVISLSIIMVTAFLLILPSRIGGRGTSPGGSAFNAIILVSNWSDILYEQYNERVVNNVRLALERDFDINGLNAWNSYILWRYGR